MRARKITSVGLVWTAIGILCCSAAADAPVYEIPRIDKITIDGKADDWAGAGGGFRVEILCSPDGRAKPPADHDARLRMAWNDSGLLLLAAVRDDKWVEHADKGWLWRYDGVEVFLAPRPGDKQMCQWAISPGMTPEQTSLRWKLHDHRKDDALKKLPAALKAARRKTDTGYLLELLVPWSPLAIRPKAGREVGVQVLVNDADQVDGETLHTAWYPADNTGFDGDNMHRVRLAAKPSPSVEIAGVWQYSWPLTSRAELWTTAAMIGRELTIVAPAGKALARGAVEHAGGRGRVKLDLPTALSSAEIAFLELRVGQAASGRLQVPEDVRENARCKLPVEALRKSLLTGKFRKPTSNPDLLFAPEQVAEIRKRAAARKDLLAKLKERCKKLLATSPEQISPGSVSGPAHGAEAAATGYFYFRDPAMAAWAKRRVRAVLGLKTWMFPLHRLGCRYTDHVMTNVGSAIARTHDLLGDRYSPSETKEIAAGVRRLLLLPYLKSVRGRNEWWAGRGAETNWKIMCHGEMGLTLCEFGAYWPEAREAMAHALLGVVEALDMVPPEGDWHEGVTYWLVTLHHGLRYLTALRRLTGGAVNAYEHPALKTTGDFAMMLTTPSHHVFNFSDNHDTHIGPSRECLAMLANEAKRADWMYIARGSPSISPLYLAAADGDRPATKPTPTAALFPRTGAAAARGGWNQGDTFVGMKFGAATVGHGHLDAGSFVIESGGRWLVQDSGYWNYPAQDGFHDYRRHRWNWDNTATVGHSTLLIDGKGQTWQLDRVATPHSLRSGKGWDMISTDVARCYPGMLSKFVRTILFVKPDVVVVRDVVECEGDRHAEWLLHYGGTVRSEGVVSVVENKGVSLTVVPFLPSRKLGWRVNDVTRTSTYEKEGSAKEITKAVRYRSFAPFRKSKRFEFLFGLRVKGRPDAKDWTFKKADGAWTLEATGHDLQIRPKGDTLDVRE